MTKLRAPAYPLVTVDPYFSLWSMSDILNGDVTRHWTGAPQRVTGIAEVDGKEYLWMGDAEKLGKKPLEQILVDFNALSTKYVFSGGGIELTAVFTSTLLPQDLMLLSRPVSYLNIKVKSIDGDAHVVKLKLNVMEEICLDTKGEMPVEVKTVSMRGVGCARMGGTQQPVLQKKGDDVRINWGYFYLAARNGRVYESPSDAGGEKGLTAEILLKAGAEKAEALFLLAYDDINCLEYFGKRLQAYWKHVGGTIEKQIEEAARGYETIKGCCDSFSRKLTRKAAIAGGERYAEILSLAFRQVIAAHKLAFDENGEIMFISKECFSNGCAATVDVSYPSVPLFLIFNPELVKGMMRPVLRYASGGLWPYDFAPHDVGRYPVLNGQVYGSLTDTSDQMPVEECGDMLIMFAAVCIAEKNASFALKYMPLIQKWAGFLLKFGVDPAEQLCTDDFAGHLAHNCNLSAKTIMAIASYGIILGMGGDKVSQAEYMETAKAMAGKWVETAANGDGSFRLAFDMPGSFSMKYNLVWDKLFGTGIFPEEAIRSEIRSYAEKFNRYGLPLDNRADYTKSDWLMWIAALNDSDVEFSRCADALWNTYNETKSRVPMTDWYDTKTARQVCFQNRSVQGGLFIRLLDYLKICRYK